MKKYIYTLMFILIQGAALSFSGNGSGTEEDPYQITNVYELQEMKDNFYAHYILMNDIDASETRSWNVRDHDYDPHTPDSATGFEPVGVVMGGLNGNGHIIRNLYINRPSGWGSSLIQAGMNKAYIINLGIEDCYISGCSNTAALIGVAEPSFRIEKCYSTGTVISPIGRPEGLAGLIATNKYASVINCYSRCEVISNYPPVDGLVASFCCGTSGARACYTTGKVSLPENDIKVYPFGTYSNNGNSRCYWDTETTGISTEGIPYDHANGRTTEEMMKQSTYLGWDFDNIWCIDEGNDYPKLRVFGDCPSTGVEENPIPNNKFSIYINPNPAADEIEIKYSLPKSCYVNIQIFNFLGISVKKILNGRLYSEGTYKETFFTSDLPPGVYFVTLNAGMDILTKQLVVIR